MIAAQKSYFETIGRPSLLQHLWSLAVEEQFYLLWPLVFALLLTRLKTRGALLVLMLGATLSALWMGALYHPDTDPSRVYYGTDTRAFGLLLGAALAFVWSPQADGTTRSRRVWLLDGIGFLALAGLGAAFIFLDEFNPFLYQGGMLLVSAATAFLIAAVVHPKSPLLGPILGLGILQWLGVRSYSLYLWHWPVFMLTRPQLDTPLEGAPLLG
ncbi:MAG: acetyltransferase, partial [Chloroflexi bacterium]